MTVNAIRWLQSIPLHGYALRGISSWQLEPECTTVGRWFSMKQQRWACNWSWPQCARSWRSGSGAVRKLRGQLQEQIRQLQADLEVSMTAAG